MSFGPPYPNPGNDENGFYVPEAEKYHRLYNYQEFVNSHEGIINLNQMDAIHNLIMQLPKYVNESLQLAGEQVVWLRRKTNGARCPYYNDIEDQCRVSKCQTCFNTNFVGGYDFPIILKASFEPGKSDILIEEAGLTVTQRPSARCAITDPIMSEKDILVSFSNERYEIHSAEAIELQGHKYEQQITLSRIDKADIKYYVPVPGIMGQDFTDFVACIKIVQTSTSFPATITIRNFNFEFPNDGLTY